MRGPINMNDFFAKMAKTVSDAVGSTYAFLIAFGAVLLWAVSGPLFHFSQGWQLVINTGTTIITFLMVFIIQNAENRDEKAIQLKLDELLRATGEARTGFADLQELDDATLKELQRRSRILHEEHAADVEDAVREEEESSRTGPRTEG
jgi:low affinity Fe/Cu permease